MRGTIDGAEVYLDEGQLPAFTLSIDSISDPSKFKGTASTTIRVIATKEARQVFGSEHFNSGRTSADMELVIGEASERLFASNVVPVRQTRDEVECVAVGGNASWFSAIKDKRISELDLGISPIVDAAYQRSTWTDSASTLYFVLADHGSFEGHPSSHNVEVTKLRPALRTHSILSAALAKAGYRIIPKGTLAGHWKNFVHYSPGASIHSISNDSNPDTAIVRPAFGGSITVTTSPVLSTPGWLNTVETWDPNDNFNGGFIASAERYLAPFDTRISVELRGVIVSDIPPALDGTRLRIVLYEKTQNIPLSLLYSDPLPAGGSITINATFPDVFIEEGMEVNVGYWNEVTTNEDVTFSDSSARIRFIPKTRPYAADCALDIATCGGDLTVAEMLKAQYASQFLAFVTDNESRTVSVWFEKEYYRQPVPGQSSRDWTTRMDHTVAPAKNMLSMPRRILYRWKPDTSDLSMKRQNALIKSPGYGNADVQIAGLGSDLTVSVPYASTAMGYVLGGLRIPVLRTKASSGADDYDRGDRLLYVDGMRPGNWTHATDALTEYPAAYFAREDGSHPIAFGNVAVYGDEAAKQTVDTLGAARHLRMRTSAFLEAYLFIRDHELQDFDHGMPTLVDDGSGPAWYWVQEIQQHRFGIHQPTKCLLVQIPTKEVQLSVSNPPITYPEQPFLCSGAGYGSVEIVSLGTLIANTTSGYYTIRSSAGVFTTTASGDSASVSEGVLCIWASDAAGNKTGDITLLQITASIGASDITGLSELEDFQADVAAPQLDLSGQSYFTSIDVLGSDDLQEVVLPSSITFEYANFMNCGLLVASVNAILAKVRASGYVGGTLNLSGGTNAAPTGQGILDKAYIASPVLMSIADTGNSNIDGTYDPNGTVNSRPAYIHAVNGITEVFWTGAQWRILATDAILDSYDDVAQPWLTTTWILVSGTASDPTINAPGLNWTVTTN